MTRSLRKILIVEPYGIGDLLFLTPVLRALRLVPTVEKVDLILGSRTEAAVRANPHIDDIYVIDKDLEHARSWSENLAFSADLTRRLRSEHYDLLLDYSQRSEYGFWAQFFLGISKRAGFSYRRRGLFLNLPVPLENGFSGRHVIDYYAEIAERAGIPVEDRYLEYYLSREDLAKAGQMLKDRLKGSPVWRRYAVVSAGGGESWGKDAFFKRWPVRFYAEFVNHLAKSQKFEGVVLAGSGPEKALAEELLSGLSIPAINFSGECSLNVTAALIQNAAAFIGNDGGLMHLAHAFKKPVIAFFGPVDPKIYGPYPPSSRAQVLFKQDLECRPCYKKFRYQNDCAHRACLQEFTVQEAEAQLTETFKNSL